MKELFPKEYMVYNLYENLKNVFRDEDEKYHYAVKNEDLNEDYFVALLLAFKIHFSQLTEDNDTDLIGFISILNKLALQHLLEEAMCKESEANPCSQ